MSFYTSHYASPEYVTRGDKTCRVVENNTCVRYIVYINTIIFNMNGPIID